MLECDWMWGTIMIIKKGYIPGTLTAFVSAIKVVVAHKNRVGVCVCIIC